MNEVDAICDLIDRIHSSGKRIEDLGISILKILEEMESIETLIEENKNG